MSSKQNRVEQKTVAVSGASGFLGASLCRELDRIGFQVLPLSRTGSPPIDYSDLAGLEKRLAEIQVLVHTAGLTNGSRDALIDANLTTTKNLVETVQHVSVERFILISSAAAVFMKGEYGKIKREAENCLQDSGVDHVIFRPTLIYGPGDNKNVATMARLARISPIIPLLGGGHFKVQPIYIDDVVSVIIQSIRQAPRESIYNLSGPEQVSVKEMMQHIVTFTGRKCFFVPVPLKPAQIAVRFYHHLVPMTRLPVKQILELDKHERFDISATRRDFDFAPIPFDEGLRKTVEKEGG